MTQAQSVLLAVLKTALNPNMPLPEPDCCNWEEVYQEAKAQTVSLIFYDAVAPLLPSFPADLRRKIESTGLQVIMSNLNAGNTQARLTNLLQQEGIPHLILKGEGSASYYPKPQLRTLGDVDFIVSPKDFDTLHTLFCKLGYRFDESQKDHHIAYYAPGSVLEMHKELPGIPNGAPGEILRDHLQDLLLRTQRLNIGSGEFSAPDPQLHGLILLLHSLHHLLSAGLGLRHLMDWCCYVNQTKEASFWEDRLLPLLARIGLSRFAQVLTGVCTLAFDTPCPSWASPEESLCRELLEDMLAGGNFGCKDSNRQASALMVSNAGKDGTTHSKLFYLWKTFHTSVKAHYPICEKCGICYLIFYPVRGIRYLWRILTGKRRSLIKAIPQADQRRNLYGELHIFEVEKHG